MKFQIPSTQAPGKYQAPSSKSECCGRFGEMRPVGGTPAGAGETPALPNSYVGAAGSNEVRGCGFGTVRRGRHTEHARARVVPNDYGGNAAARRAAARGIGGGDASLTRSRDGYATGTGRAARWVAGCGGHAAAGPGGKRSRDTAALRRRFCSVHRAPRRMSFIISRTNSGVRNSTLHRSRG